jgi:hypothetical protein
MTDPKTTTRECAYFGVDYITHATGDKWGDHDYLDVPLEGFTTGCATGARFAWQLMQAVRSQVCESDVFRPCLEAAIEVLDQPQGVAQMKSVDYRDKRGAAVGLLEGLTAVLQHAAHTTDWETALRPHVDGEAQCFAEEAAKAKATAAAFYLAQAKQKAELAPDTARRGERAAAARKAKREAKQGVST